MDKIGRMISLGQMGAEDAEPIYKKIEEIKSLTEFLIANISSDALTQDTVLQKRNLLVQIQNAVKNLSDFLETVPPSLFFCIILYICSPFLILVLRVKRRYFRTV